MSVPADTEGIAFLKLGKQLNSDIIYLHLFGYDFVVLNSAQAATELLDKRSALYSDRLCPAMMREPSLLDWADHPVFLGYGDAWRNTRRMMNNWLNGRAVTKYYSQQERQARLLVQELAALSGSPQPFAEVKHELLYTMASSMFQLVYGYELQGKRDMYLEKARTITDNANGAAMFTSKSSDLASLSSWLTTHTDFLVNIFPVLVHVPDWLPGAGWKRTAREWRSLKEEAINSPYEWTKAQVNKGIAQPSVVSSLLQDHSSTIGMSPKKRRHVSKKLLSLYTKASGEFRVDEYAPAYETLTLYIGGSDTSASTLLVFVAAMVTHPDVQIKAQQELDDVLGFETLPTIADRERLPYIQNIINELFRWQPVFPTGIPHMCWQDDIYRGYNIDKGTVVQHVVRMQPARSASTVLYPELMHALRAMSRDERFYEDPEVFNPDRYLDPNVPIIPMFGWGRRRCPGMYFAEPSLFVRIASILATLTLSKKKDANGIEITPVIEPGANTAIVCVSHLPSLLK
ncbi:cytochrome P450 [Rhizoctonia solani]|uniref:Cytochrome P450 n=1 Tax=Rhizoctonia solani TaxID=456999 RepID=A0A8H7M9A1_9AGAM|nr:cytochrome P450 [Rhizoctonia solani]